MIRLFKLEEFRTHIISHVQHCKLLPQISLVTKMLHLSSDIYITWKPIFDILKNLCFSPHSCVRMMVLEQSKRRRALFRRRKSDVLIRSI
jgi:hypothetical protein